MGQGETMKKLKLTYKIILGDKKNAMKRNKRIERSDGVTLGRVDKRNLSERERIYLLIYVFMVLLFIFHKLLGYG